jgi:hypothetical protein
MDTVPLVVPMASCTLAAASPFTLAADSSPARLHIGRSMETFVWC